MGNVSPDAIFTACVMVLLTFAGLALKIAVDFGIMKTKIKAAHKRIDKLNGVESKDDDE